MARSRWQSPPSRSCEGEKPKPPRPSCAALKRRLTAELRSTQRVFMSGGAAKRHGHSGQTGQQEADFEQEVERQADKRLIEWIRGRRDYGADDESQDQGVLPEALESIHVQDVELAQEEDRQRHLKGQT